MALGFSLILLGGALFLRFADDDGNPSATPMETPDVNVIPIGESSTSTPALIATPVPTVAPIQNVRTPIAGQLTEGLVGNVSKLNPLFANLNPVDRDITALMFEGLTTTNTFGETIPLLAERWDVSRDGLEYVFILRRDIKWHDGTPFTTRDVRYTINTIRDNDFPGERALRDFWRTVEMIIIDDYTVRFRLVQPLAIFPEQLKIGLLPAHVLAGYPVAELYRHPFNLAPIGTGAYQLENLYLLNNQWSVSLRVAPVFRERPEGQTGYRLDRIVFRTFGSVEAALAAFARGEVNTVAGVPTQRLPALDSVATVSIYTRVQPTVGVLLYNWQNDEVAYLSNPRIHQAFALTLDRQDAVERALSGQAIVANSPLIPGGWAYEANISYPQLNAEQARVLLESVSFERVIDEDPPDEDADTSDDGEAAASEEIEGDITPTPPAEVETVTMRRELTILVVNEPPQIALAENLAAQLSTLGLTVTVDANSAPTYRSRLVSRDFDLAIVEYTFAPYADPDPYVFWHSSQTRNGANYAGVNDFRVNDLIERARRELQGSIRIDLYRQLQERFVERAPALPLYHPLYAYVTDNRLQNVQLGYLSTPADRFRDIAAWHWQSDLLAQPDA